MHRSTHPLLVVRFLTDSILIKPTEATMPVFCLFGIKSLSSNTLSFALNF